MTKDESNKTTKQIKLMAVQALYAYAVHESITEKEKLNIDVLLSNDSQHYSKMLNIAQSWQHNKTTIDNLIKNFISVSWSTDRINMVAVAILRAALADVMFVNTVYPMNKLLNYYLAVAEILLTKKDVHFIKAMLSKISDHYICQKEVNSA